MHSITCSTCGQQKSAEFFCHAPRNKSGFSKLCKSCKSLYDKTCRTKPQSEEQKLKKKMYAKEYRRANRDSILLDKQRRYYANLEEERRKRSEYMSRRRKVDIELRLKQNVSRRIREMLGRNLTYKNNRTIDYLGCGLQEFKSHLESKFQPGMNWTNYGDWHIDHIKPCASFDLTQERDQKACFNYSNLQPLWAIDNLKKGATG